MREQLIKLASLTLLTGQMGAGKTTMSNRLASDYDDVYHSDVGYVDKKTGTYVIPKGEEKRKAIAAKMRAILASHKAGRRVLLDGYPNSMTGDYAPLLPHVDKVLHLDHGPIRSNYAVVRRSFERGSSPWADLKYALGDRKATNASLQQIKDAVGKDRVSVIDRSYREKTASALRERVRVLVTRYQPPSEGELGSIRFAMRMGDKRVGSLSAVLPYNGTPYVASTQIDPEYRGLGLGRKLYGEAIRRVPGGSLRSDNNVSYDAARVWEGMAKARDRKGSLTYGNITKAPDVRESAAWEPGSNAGYRLGLATDAPTSVFSAARLPEKARIFI